MTGKGDKKPCGGGGWVGLTKKPDFESRSMTCMVCTEFMVVAAAAGAAAAVGDVV